MLLHSVRFTVLGVFATSVGLSATLPSAYFPRLQEGIAKVSERLAAEPERDLKSLEARPGWSHFPSAILIAAVLYAKQDAANRMYRDAKMLTLAREIGDILAAENEQGRYATRLDHHRDTYMWLEAYRLLEGELGAERGERWRRALVQNLGNLAADVAKKKDQPWYQSPFIGTSPNHLSLWASTLYLGAKVFNNREWEELAGYVMHRFAAEEQTPDGYWGEHSRAGPTTGYDYLTVTAVALYWEHSRDPAALDALRRSTDFHKYFTYPDGTPVETINDRNRYWEVSAWGHFGFSHFSDGRRYADFLAASAAAGRFSLEALGRFAQNALYFHAGDRVPTPQDLEKYSHRMSVPAGIRKSGPWVICLSGLIDTPAPANQFYLDRQGNVSVFHEKLGLIVTGANSKRQPELATFSEQAGDQLSYLPLSSRLQMNADADLLSLAYNRFFSVLRAAIPPGGQVSLRFAITPVGRMTETQLTLQLCLKAGQPLETGAGRREVLENSRIELGPEALGGWIRHNGWTMKVGPSTRLVWPVYPHNPYANAPERGLGRAVGALVTPLERRAEEITFMVLAGN